MKVLVLFIFVWTIVNCAAKVELGWDESLNENDIYYAENDIHFDGNEINWREVEGTQAQARLPNWLFIFPGTKWCGSGNISNDFDDLGQFADTDKCCRSHDFCDDVIPAHETQYNLTNPSFYSRLSCECDVEFKKCLRDVNSAISTKVGFIYFNVLNTQCFRKDYPAKCVNYSFVPTRKCVEYEYDTSQAEEYQWFDVPQY